MDRLPINAPGHWSSAEGCDIATEYAHKSRADLMHGEMSDLALANEQYMVSRDSLDLLPMQTAAKERIRWLSAQLFIAQRQAADMAEILLDCRRYLTEFGSVNPENLVRRIDGLAIGVDIKVNAEGGQ